MSLAVKGGPVTARLGSRCTQFFVVLTVAALYTVNAFGNAAVASNTATGSWPYSNGDLANTRDAVGSTITLANVSTLKKAWSFVLKGKSTKNVGGYGTLAANPIVVNGVVYIQDLHSNVYALSLATGKLEWSYYVNKKEKSGPGPNGVAVVNGAVYGASPFAVFALNATTGHLLWSNSKLLKKGQGSFGIQPQVANGRVYVASQYGLVPGGECCWHSTRRPANASGRLRPCQNRMRGCSRSALALAGRGKHLSSVPTVR